MVYPVSNGGVFLLKSKLNLQFALLARSIQSLKYTYKQCLENCYIFVPIAKKINDNGRAQRFNP